MAAVCEEEARLAARCLSHLICVPMALFTITDLEVLDILAKAGGTDMSADEIVQEMVDAKGLVVSNPKAAQSLDRVLRVLASHSILTSVSCAPRAVASSEAGVPQPHTVIKYGLTPMCKYLAKLDGEQAGLSLAPYVLLQREKAFMDCWPHLADAILTGSMPFASAHGGCSMYEYIQTDDGLSTAFNLAMSSHSRLLMGPLLEAYEGFGAVKTLVDVGGGIGFCVAKIVGKHPHIHGVNFDLPHVVRAAPPHPGVEHVGGDMFQSVPSGDAIFMKHILHTWDDAECHKILENCWRALPATAAEGKFIVVEILVPPPTSPAVGTGGSDRMAYLLDLCMLTFTPRGKERTFAEFHSLALAAGFSRIKTACYVGAFHILELYK